MKYLKFVLFCTISANALAAVKAAVVGETVWYVNKCHVPFDGKEYIKPFW